MNVETMLGICAEMNIPATAQDSGVSGYHLEAALSAETTVAFAERLLSEEFYLVFLTAVDVSPSCCVVCQFAKYDSPLRVQTTVFASSDGVVPSIAGVYHGAGWYEREVHDFFGITFSGNEDMRPLILSEMDAGFHPLLKTEKKRKSAADLGLAPQPAAAEDQTGTGEAD